MRLLLTEELLVKEEHFAVHMQKCSATSSLCLKDSAAGCRMLSGLDSGCLLRSHHQVVLLHGMRHSHQVLLQ